MLLDGPCTLTTFFLWWMPRTIGAQTRATQFFGDMVPGLVMITNWMAYFRKPTHLEQIMSLTQRLNQAHLFIRHLGGDPSEVDNFDPFGSTIGPSSDPVMDSFVRRDPPLYRPDIPFGGDTMTQEELAQVDRLGDIDV